jgi:hypothetical protein
LHEYNSRRGREKRGLTISRFAGIEAEVAVKDRGIPSLSTISAIDLPFLGLGSVAVEAKNDLKKRRFSQEEALHVDCSPIGLNATFDANTLASINRRKDIGKAWWTPSTSSERSKLGYGCRGCNSKGNANSDGNESIEHLRGLNLQSKDFVKAL